MIGSLTVITGPMFSGKSTALVKYLEERRAQGEVVQAIRPVRDTRDGMDSVTTHDGEHWPATRVHRAEEIAAALLASTQVVGIDESNMFGVALGPVCLEWMKAGKHVVVAGLNLDYQGRPFAPIPQLLCFADRVITCTSRCACCGAPARLSQRLTRSSALILPGGAGVYEPRCLACHIGDIHADFHLESGNNGMDRELKSGVWI